MSHNRTAEISRRTRETDIRCKLNLDGNGDCRVATGIGFLDHMLTALARHGRIELSLSCSGDLAVDDHHTAEDCAIVLGDAFNQALGDRVGISRFGYAYAPLDEALCRTVIDLSGRPWAEIHPGFRRESIGSIATENLTHFLQTFAIHLRASVHVDCLRGENDHHRAEAAFKSLALALRQAVGITGTDIPSTKGTLT